MKILIFVMLVTLRVHAAKEKVDVIVTSKGSSARPAYFVDLKTFIPNLPGVKKVQFENVKVSGFLAKALEGGEIQKVRIDKAKNSILIVFIPPDPSADTFVIPFLMEKFQVNSLIHVGSCGTLSDRIRILDVLVPKKYFRDDFEYLNSAGQALLFPDWPNKILVSVYEKSYSFEQPENQLTRNIEALSKSKFWKDFSALATKDQKANPPNNNPAILTDVTNITGAKFISGDKPRIHYRDYFKADTVEMRAQQIVMAAHQVGIDTLSVLSCADKASERPVDAMTELMSNITVAARLGTLVSIQAILGGKLD